MLLHAPTRKSVACFGSVSLSTGKFVRRLCDKFDALTFEAFLKKLLRHRSRGKRMVIVLDNAKYHHAVLLAPLLRRYRKVLSLLFLPPYSPQLAPIERVWKLAPGRPCSASADDPLRRLNEAINDRLGLYVDS